MAHATLPARGRWIYLVCSSGVCVAALFTHKIYSRRPRRCRCTVAPGHPQGHPQGQPGEKEKAQPTADRPNHRTDDRSHHRATAGSGAEPPTPLRHGALVAPATFALYSAQFGSLMVVQSKVRPGLHLCGLHASATIYYSIVYAPR